MTDTNQASEDGLIIAIETLVNVSLDLGKQAKMMTLADVHTPQAIPDNEKLNIALQPYKDKVLHIIRTEKLKLLATIGQPTLNDVGLMQPEQYEGGIIINDWYKNRINKLKAEL